jgi:hypothetical protein
VSVVFTLALCFILIEFAVNGNIVNLKAEFDGNGSESPAAIVTAH